MQMDTCVACNMIPPSHWPRNVDRPSISPLGSGAQALSVVINGILLSGVRDLISCALRTPDTLAFTREGSVLFVFAVCLGALGQHGQAPVRGRRLRNKFVIFRN